MANGILYVLLVTASIAASYATMKSGIIVTAPNTWILNREEKICVSFHGIDFDVATATTITKDGQVFSRKVNFNQGTDGCFTMAVEGSLLDMSTGQMPLQFTAEGTGGATYSFTDESTVYLVNYRDLEVNVTFVEMDKPMYKPGDEVKFRVLTVQEDLKPRLDNIPLVYITNPLQIRMIQWKNVDIQASQGIGEFSMELTSDPTYGEWKIHVQTASGQTEVKKFEVKEYVLPKFELVLKPPTYMPIGAETVESEVCAHYTYGEPVKGNLTLDMCMKVPQYQTYGSTRREYQCHNVNAQINGCQKFDIRVQDLLGPDNVPGSNMRQYYNLFVHVNATVEEEGTGVVMNSSFDTPSLGFDLYDLKFADMAQYFKPGLPYQGKLSVTNTADGTPAVGMTVTVTPKDSGNPQTGLSLVTDSNGIATWTWTNLSLAEGEDNLMIEALLDLDLPASDPYSQIYQDPDAMTSVKAWYSPSDSYLVIDSVSKDVDCGGRLVAHVAYTQGHNHQFYYKVTTQYSIVQEGALQHTHGANGVTVDIELPDDVWGDSNLVVYYVRHDGEIVADSTAFKVGHCVKNNVEMSFSSPEVAPGEDVDVELKASPGSICAYGVMDESVKLLGGGNSVTMSQILSRLPMKTPTRQLWNYEDEYCNEQIRIQEEEEEEQDKKKEEERKKSREERRKNRRERKNRRPRSVMGYPGHSGGGYSRYLDSSQAFKVLNMVVISDLTMDTRPCEPQPIFPYYAYRYIAYDAADFLDMPEQAYFEPPMAMPMPGAPGPMPTLEESPVAVPAPATAPVVDTIRSFFPETWLWALTTIGPSGMSSLPQKAPDTITEWLGHATCTHLDDGLGMSPVASLRTFQPFFVSFTLPYSVVRGETVHMPVSVFNYLTECLVIQMELESSTKYRLASGSATTDICVCGQEKKTHNFPITALELGHINITVKAASIDKAGVCGNMLMSTQIGVRDTVIRELLIEPEGKEVEFADSAFVCPSGGTDTRTVSLILPSDLVPDSAMGYVSVMGDVMGPALSGLDALIRLPTGCGEQTMLSFAPNVYILQYLTNTGQLTPDIEKKTLGFLRSGYQRELTYRHPDGSYSAFGTDDPSGSTWLSAFVLKSFSQAKEFVDIDEEDFQKTREWFRINQRENGCYRHVGRIIHKSMKGGLAGSSDNSPALTAYVLGAMLESSESSQTFMVSGAVDCLRVQTFSDAYTVALTAYALTKWDPNHHITRDYMDRLDALKTEQDGYVHWQGSAEVETTAYALMAQMQFSSSVITEVLPIVRWLTAQRNPGGGFQSTQDTVVGLQALAKFAERAHGSQGEINVKVAQSAAGGDLNFAVDADNQLLLQREQLTVPNELTFETTGQGCVFLQSTMKYNIKDMTTGSQPSIFIEVSPSRSEDNNCRHRILKTCFRYEGPDDRTNMALMDIKMVSGWTPDTESVERLKQDTTLNIMRVEMEKNKVFIYFNELLRDQLMCAEFMVVEDIMVSNARPGSVSIFDYYDQDNVFAQKPYTLRSICGTKEEIPLDAIATGDPDNVDEIVQLRQPPGPMPPQPEPAACPRCYTQNVDAKELKNVFCSASHVYHGVARRNGRVKFNKDLTKTGSEARVRKTVVVTMDESCTCDVINERGNNVWIITADSMLEETGRNRGALLLSEKDTVFPVDQKPRALIKALRKARRSSRCQN